MAFDPNAVHGDYGDPEVEGYACRTGCALFDYSFIGRARLAGPGALDGVGELTRRPLTCLRPGRIRYALREDSNGHPLSDLTVSRHGAAVYEVLGARSVTIPPLALTGPPRAVAAALSRPTAPP